MQIVVTVIIFIVTLTKAVPAFPIIIIALVPIRLQVMHKIWHREVLRFVDSWACREGTPEDNQDKLATDCRFSKAVNEKALETHEHTV